MEDDDGHQNILFKKKKGRFCPMRTVVTAMGPLFSRTKPRGRRFPLALHWSVPQFLWKWVLQRKWQSPVSSYLAHVPQIFHNGLPRENASKTMQCWRRIWFSLRFTPFSRASFSRWLSRRLHSFTDARQAHCGTTWVFFPLFAPSKFS